MALSASQKQVPISTDMYMGTGLDTHTHLPCQLRAFLVRGDGSCLSSIADGNIESERRADIDS